MKITIILGFAWLVLFYSTVVESSHHSLTATKEEKASRRNGDNSGSAENPYKAAFSNLGNLMKEMLTVVDASSAVTLSITNNCANFELSEPQWYIMPGTNMDGPPAFVLKKEETMIITMKGGKIPGFSSWKFWKKGAVVGTEGMMSYKFGDKWLIVVWSVPLMYPNKFHAEITNTDPFPMGFNVDTALKKFKDKAIDADKYGTWHDKTDGQRSVMYSMGGANKAPFHIFVA